MKRKAIISVLSAVMVLTMALCIFAACNPDGGEQTPEEPTKYTVSYSLGEYDGDSLAPASESVTAGGKVTLPAVGVTWADHNFTCWKKDGDETEYHPGDEYTVNGDAEFVAQWEEVSYDHYITYLFEYEDDDVTVQVGYNGESTTVADIDSLGLGEEYIFLGFFYQVEGDSNYTYYSTGDTVTGDQTLKVAFDVFLEQYQGGYMLRQFPDGSAKLYSGYDQEYNAIEMDATVTIEGTTITVVLNGATFTGTFTPYHCEKVTDKTERPAFEFGADLSINNKGTYINFGDGSTIDSFTLTVDWGEYTEGEAPEPVEKDAGSELYMGENLAWTFSLYWMPEWDGHIFTGWKVKNADGTLGDTLYGDDDKYIVTGDVTFVAQWKTPDTFTATFVLGDDYAGETDPSDLTITITEGEYSYDEYPDVTDWEGHKLMGWTATNAAGEEVTGKPGQRIELTESLTFTAQWSATHTVNYWYPDDWTAGTFVAHPVNLAEGENLLDNAPNTSALEIPHGKEFGGWAFGNGTGAIVDRTINDDDVVGSADANCVLVTLKLGTQATSIAQEYQGIYLDDSSTLIIIDENSVYIDNSTIGIENIFVCDNTCSEELFRDNSYIVYGKSSVYHITKTESGIKYSYRRDGGDGSDFECAPTNPDYVEYVNKDGVTIKGAYGGPSVTIVSLRIDKDFLGGDEDAFPYFLITFKSNETPVYIRADYSSYDENFSFYDEVSGQNVTVDFDGIIANITYGDYFSGYTNAGQLTDASAPATTFEDFVGVWKTASEDHTLVYAGGGYFIMDGTAVWSIREDNGKFDITDCAPWNYYTGAVTDGNLVLTPTSDGEAYTFTSRSDITNGLNAEDYVGTAWTFGKYSVKFDADHKLQLSYGTTDWKDCLWTDEYSGDDEPYWEAIGEYIMFYFTFENAVNEYGSTTYYIVKPSEDAFVGKYVGDETQGDVHMGSFVDHERFDNRYWGKVYIFFDWEKNSGIIFVNDTEVDVLILTYSTETYTFSVKSLAGKKYTFVSMYKNQNHFVLTEVGSDTKYDCSGGGNGNGAYTGLNGSFVADGVSMELSNWNSTAKTVDVTLTESDGEPEQLVGYECTYTPWLIVVSSTKAYAVKKDGDNLVGKVFDETGVKDITFSPKKEEVEPNDPTMEEKITGTWGTLESTGGNGSCRFKFNGDGTGTAYYTSPMVVGGEKSADFNYTIDAEGNVAFKAEVGGPAKSFTGKLNGDTLHIESTEYQATGDLTKQPEPNDEAMEANIKGTWGTVTDDTENYTVTFNGDGTGVWHYVETGYAEGNFDYDITYTVDAAGNIAFKAPRMTKSANPSNVVAKYNAGDSSITISINSPANPIQNVRITKIADLEEDGNDPEMEEALTGTWGTLKSEDNEEYQITFNGDGTATWHYKYQGQLNDSQITYTVDAEGNVAFTANLYGSSFPKDFKAVLSGNDLTFERSAFALTMDGYVMHKIQEEEPEEPDLSEYYKKILQNLTVTGSDSGNSWSFTFDGSYISIEASGVDYGDGLRASVSYSVDKSGKVTAGSFEYNTHDRAVTVTISLFANKATVSVKVESEMGSAVSKTVDADPTLKGCVEEALTKQNLRGGSTVDKEDIDLEFYSNGTYNVSGHDGDVVNVKGTWSVDEDGNVTMSPIDWNGSQDVTITVTFEGTTATIKFSCSGLGITQTFTVEVSNPVPGGGTDSPSADPYEQYAAEWEAAGASELYALMKAWGIPPIPYIPAKNSSSNVGYNSSIIADAGGAYIYTSARMSNPTNFINSAKAVLTEDGWTESKDTDSNGNVLYVKDGVDAKLSIHRVTKSGTNGSVMRIYFFGDTISKPA